LGVVSWGGSWWRPEKGFNIGSGLAAGGSPLLAAWKEGRWKEKLSAAIRLELARCALIQRWMDDLWIVVVGRVSRGLRAALRELMSCHFYGEGLRLERDESGSPFGFDSVVVGNKIRLSQNQKYRRVFEGAGVCRTRSVVPAFQSFQDHHLKHGIVLGLVYRVMDLSGEAEQGLASQMTRLLRELRSQQFPGPMLRRVLRQVDREAMMPLPNLMGVAEESVQKAKVEAFSEDFARWVSQRVRDT
jgi:hypothetical protein